MIRIGTQIKDANPDLLRVISEITRRAPDATTDPVMMLRMANVSDSSAIASTANETNFSTTVTASKPMWRAGGVFRIVASGVYSTTGTPTLTLRIKAGSTNLVVFGAKTGINNAANSPFKIEAHIVCRTLGSSGTIMPFGTLFFSTSANTDTIETVVANSTTTLDLTAVQTLQISAQWSTGSLSNTTTLKNIFMEMLNY